MLPRPLRTSLLLALVAALMSFGLAAPAAADFQCSGSVGARTIDDNLRVPDGASCTLEGTVVKGNVLIGRNATLTASGITVDGSIQDDNGAAGAVQVTGSHVLGNVQLEQGTSATVDRTRIDGDLQLESNRGALRATRNTIDGNLQANQNTGGLDITGNTIEGNLQCQSNDPAPTGGSNTVRGSTEGQCRTLSSAGSTPPPATGTKRATGRLAGANRFETAVKIAQRAFPGTAPVVYVARADDFADALAGGALTDGPILLVPSCATVPEVVLAEVRRLSPQQVIALGGGGAVCDAVVTAVANA